jgi:phage terminase small subunit
MKTKRKLTPKQKLFIQYYLLAPNAHQAALAAGYSPRTAQATGSENLRKPAIAEAIAAGQAKVAVKLEITQELLAQELAKLAMVNMEDFIRIGSDGDPYIDLSELTRDQAAAINEITVDDYVEGRGYEARDVKKVRFKLHDKRASIMDLAKLLGLVVTKHEVTGKDGGPLLVGPVTETPDELRARAAQLAGATIVEDEA